MIKIVYAQTDADIILVHRFLCVVATPQMMCAVDPIKSVTEITRLVKEPGAGFVLMAIQDDKLVGTFGVMVTDWWYGHDSFLADRFFFVIDDLHHKGVGKMLEQEATQVAKELKMPLIIHGKTRRKSEFSYLILPHKRADEGA